jgi:hypothetical protein
MIFHKLFGRHVPDPQRNRWDDGYFVTQCTLCGEAMVKLPGLPWRLRPSST